MSHQFPSLTRLVINMSCSGQGEDVIEKLSAIDPMDLVEVHQQSLADHLPVHLVVVHPKSSQRRLLVF